MAVDTAKYALEYVNESYTHIRSVEENLTRDVKVFADKALEKYIVEKLSAETPFPILSEEVGHIDRMNQQETMQWIVDPLDGSLNFSRSIPLSCISIALWQYGAPVLGAIYDFNHQELFTGIVGHGAWMNDDPIHTSGIRRQSESIICTGFPVSTDYSADSIIAFAKKIRTYKKVRLLGSAALSLAYVACGRAEAYRENNIKIWDVAAGLAIVKAAGGAIEYATTSRDNVLHVSAHNGNLDIEIENTINE